MERAETEEAIAIMQAWVDGKTIQYKPKRSDSVWSDVVGNPIWSWTNTEYRVKPQAVYRPYIHPAECILDIRNNHPDGWLKVRNSDCDAYRRLNNISSITDFREYFMKYTYADGTPFGKKVN